jgi:hypothetical protein
MATSRKPPPIRIVNLEEGMPLVHEALTKLERELALARQQRYSLMKLIHGYGSSGAGGDIRIAVQKRRSRARSGRSSLERTGRLPVHRPGLF